MSELMGSAVRQPQQQATPPQGTRSNTTCGCIIMLVALVAVLGVVGRACSSCECGGGDSTTQQNQSANQAYTMAQYSRLSLGMTMAQVDSTMGGGEILVSDDGRFTMWAYTNVDAVGSQITVSFDGDILVDKSQSGL